MDQIRIENLEVYAGHGVHPYEREEGQSFLVDAVLYTDLRMAGMTDDLAFSTHYGHVSKRINSYLREHTFQLIEAAAEHLAKELLLEFPRIDALVLEVKKPHAPVKLPFSNLSVRIERGWKQAYLGIGSNMGDRRAFLEKAVQRIKDHPEIRDVQCSSWMITKPYGGVEQEDFLNGAIGIRTLLQPYELLAFLQSLEAEAGRERKVHWGPRTLDLDILFYEGFVSTDPKLTVPHPDMANREFVLKPLCEISPWQYNPVTGKSAGQMLAALERPAGGFHSSSASVSFGASSPTGAEKTDTFTGPTTGV